VLGSDLTSSTTAFADATGLSFTAAADKSYLIEFAVIFQTTNTGTGIKLGVNGPAAPVSLAGGFVIPLTLSSNNVSNFRAYDIGTATGTVDTINADTLAVGHAIFRNGPNEGTFILRFASEVNLSQIKLRSGSVLRYRQLD